MLLTTEGSRSRHVALSVFSGVSFSRTSSIYRTMISERSHPPFAASIGRRIRDDGKVNTLGLGAMQVFLAVGRPDGRRLTLIFSSLPSSSLSLSLIGACRPLILIRDLEKRDKARPMTCSSRLKVIGARSWQGSTVRHGTRRGIDDRPHQD